MRGPEFWKIAQWVPVQRRSTSCCIAPGTRGESFPMPNHTIAMLHPGEMGAAVGACLVWRGFRVLWVAQGRSAATRARADAAGLEPCETLDRALAEADVVFSVCPPHAALDLARAVAERHFRGIFVDANAGAASALKMAYAAWTKGSTALLAAIRALAQREGVDKSLLAEWKLSQPQLLRESDAVPAKVYKAWRWVAEMEEIAASFEAAGLPGGFHLAAAEIYGRLTAFRDSAAPPSLDEVTEALRKPSPLAKEGGAERSEAPRERSRAARRLKLRRG